MGDPEPTDSPTRLSGRVAVHGLPGLATGAMVVAIAAILVLATLLSQLPGTRRDQVLPGAAKPSTAEMTVEATVTRAITTLQRATIARPGVPAQSISVAEMRSQQAAIPALLSSSFTGEPLSRFGRLLSTAMSEEIADGRRDVDGGARQVIFTKVSVAAGAATVQARAQIWIRTDPVSSSQVDQTPDEWWDYDAHLVDTTHGWRIDTLTFKPEPGSAP